MIFFDTDRVAHGTRTKYIAGCRCDLCRAAHALYEKGRRAARARGETNELVRVDAAKKHLAKLSVAGVGYRAVAMHANVSETLLKRIKHGDKRWLRRATERRILSVEVPS